MTSVHKGNLLGSLAIILWATLALFTVQTRAIPPFQLTSMAFGIAFVIGVAWWWYQGAPVQVFRQVPLRVWALGIYGLFGYHFFYFMALKHAPSLEANLINYLWPLLIVMLSALLPNERLRWFHGVGAFCGALGALLLLSGEGVLFRVDNIMGYGYALLCAFIWSSYSVLSRYFGDVPTVVVGGFCGATALLSLGAHLWFETTYSPSLQEVAAVFALGCGPVGVAFFVWDYAMKRGDIKVIGAFSYATPLLSTFLLVLFGDALPTRSVWIACLLIVCGSLLSAFGSKLVIHHFTHRMD